MAHWLTCFALATGAVFDALLIGIRVIFVLNVWCRLSDSETDQFVSSCLVF